MACVGYPKWDFASAYIPPEYELSKQQMDILSKRKCVRLYVMHFYTYKV